MSEIRNYGNGTSLTVQMPWSVFVGGRALCSDGVVRSLSRIAQTADTFFSVPASVKVKGKTVSGYVTVETATGSSVETDGDPAVVKFIAYTYGRNGDMLPGLAHRTA